ncbi:hypothetical protein OG21DRAFT_1210697 [Imleria badia]|nr:hypothetical protein OG21DRAFT_1210697 [Imleria badia]
MNSPWKSKTATRGNGWIFLWKRMDLKALQLFKQKKRTSTITIGEIWCSDSRRTSAQHLWPLARMCGTGARPGLATTRARGYYEHPSDRCDSWTWTRSCRLSTAFRYYARPVRDRM